jgi:hypothetical protein
MIGTQGVDGDDDDRRVRVDMRGGLAAVARCERRENDDGEKEAATHSALFNNKKAPAFRPGLLESCDSGIDN